MGVSRSTLPESTLESRVFEAGVELVSAGSLLGAASTTEFGFSSETCKTFLGHFRLETLCLGFIQQMCTVHVALSVMVLRFSSKFVLGK